MPFTFASPKFLLLLLAIPIAIWVGRRTLAGLDPFRRRMAVGLRLLGIVLMALALSELQWKDVLDAVQVVFVVDQSLSIPKEQRQVALDVVNSCRKQIDPRRDSAKLVVFGKDAVTETTLDKDHEITQTSSLVQKEHTNLEAAIKHALQSFDPNVRRRIVLVTDGNETSGNAKNAVSQARNTKTRVDVVPLEYDYDNDILVDKVIMPTEAKLGEPFKVRVVVNAFKPTKARILLMQEGQQVEGREVDLQPGTNVEVFDLILKKAGFFRIGARVQALEGRDDKLFQNNDGNGFVFVKGESSVLYVHSIEEDGISQALVEALRNEKVSLKTMRAAEFPQHASTLQQYDAVILDNVARDNFSQAQMDAIEFAVNNEGMGLVMIGGERAFGAGEWRDTPVEKALPVEMDIKQETTIPNGALMLVMHSCEFPDGNRWGIQICQASIDTLSAKDQVGLIQYGNMGGVEMVFKLQPATNKAKLKALAATMNPGDMPDFDAVFVKALDELKPANAAVKHMILLSDGDPSPPRPEVLAAYKQQRITCSTVIICPHGGKNGGEHALMQRIANELGGKCYYVDNPKELPKIFTRETQRVARSLIVNADFTPRRAQRSEVLKGIDGLPTLRGHVLTEPKPRADVPLVSNQGAPILAHWQYGAGKSLAFTSDCTPRWAANWVRWGGYQNFWAQAIRWVSKDVQDSPFQVSTKVQGENGKVILDAVDDQGNFIDGLSVEGAVRSPKDERIDVKLKQVAPGRYEGEFPAKDVGAYTVSVLTKDREGKRKHSFTTGMVSPYSEEFKKLKTDRVLLNALAAGGEGKVIEAKDAVAGTNGFRGFFSRKSEEDVEHALRDQWTRVLAIAVICFLLDVAIRRVAIDWDKVFAKIAGPFKGGPRRGPERAATMDRLMARKQEVAKEQAVEKFEAPTAPPSRLPSKPLSVAGSQAPLAGGAPPPTSGSSPPSSEKKEEAPSVYTNRLLEAKRRAMRDLEEKKDEEKK